MFGSGVLKCKFCGREFSSIQALRAHLRGCKSRPESFVTSVRIYNRADWERFKAFCRHHGLTTCHIINIVVKALPMVEQTGVRFEIKDGKLNVSGVQGTNPIVFNFQINETFLSKPRSRWKIPVAEDPLSRAVECEWLIHKDWAPGRLGWCERFKRWVTVEKCLGCRES